MITIHKNKIFKENLENQYNYLRIKFTNTASFSLAADKTCWKAGPSKRS